MNCGVVIGSVQVWQIFGAEPGVCASVVTDDDIARGRRWEEGGRCGQGCLEGRRRLLLSVRVYGGLGEWAVCQRDCRRDAVRAAGQHSGSAARTAERTDDSNASPLRTRPWQVAWCPPRAPPGWACWLLRRSRSRFALQAREERRTQWGARHTRNTQTTDDTRRDTHARTTAQPPRVAHLASLCTSTMSSLTRRLRE